MTSCVCATDSGVSDSVTQRTVACQAPLSMGFSRQEYWSGLPFPSPGDLPNPGIEPASEYSSPVSPALAGRFFTTTPLGKFLHDILSQPLFPSPNVFLSRWHSGKASACNAGNLGVRASIPGLGRSPGKGNGNPLQYPRLEKSHGHRTLVGCSP